MKVLLSDMRSRYAIPRKRAADELVQIGALAVPGLTEALSDRYPEVQQTAAEALEKIGTPEALAAVEAWRAQQ
jgi:HEAT repeat protein